MAMLLDKAQSSYFPAFKKMFKDVVSGIYFANSYLSVSDNVLLTNLFEYCLPN